MEPAHSISARGAVATQYFLYFGVMGIFLPYFNLYCYHLGFNGFQIGLLSAVRSVILAIFPIIWGALADRFGARRNIYIACNFISTAIWAALLATTDFGTMLVICIVYSLFYTPLISFLEAFSMDTLGAQKGKYGHLRAWGSISFIAVVVVLGKVTQVMPIRIIVPLILAGSLAQAVGALGLPPNKAPTTPSSASPRLGILGQRRMVIFLLCAFLMLVSHGTYYGFFSIHLEGLGCSRLFIGASWALASTAEIVVMLASERLFRRFSPDAVLQVSLIAAALRWALLCWLQWPPLVLLFQILHALTYGSFHMASILYVDALTDRQTKTLGQAVNNAITYGLGLTTGFLVNGALFETIGAAPLFGLSAAIALAAALLFRYLQTPLELTERRTSNVER